MKFYAMSPSGITQAINALYRRNWEWSLPISNRVRVKLRMNFRDRWMECIIASLQYAPAHIDLFGRGLLFTINVDCNMHSHICRERCLFTVNQHLGHCWKYPPRCLPLLYNAPKSCYGPLLCLEPTFTRISNFLSKIALLIYDALALPRLW